MREALKLILGAVLFAGLFVLVFQLGRDVREASSMAETPDLFDSGVPRDASALLASYHEEASARLRQMVLKPVGMKQSSREFRQARAAAQVVQVDRVLADLGRKTSGWVGANMPRAARDGRARAERQAREAGVRPDDSPVVGSFDQIDAATIRTFALDALADLTKAAESMGDRAKRLLRATAQEGLSEADINRILAVGAIEGKPVETIRRLAEELRKVHGDLVEVIDRNGRAMNFKVRDYAEMVARTKTREASTHARHERLQELGLDLVAIQGRVSDTFCTAFLGQVFSLSGRHPRFPAYAKLPGGGPPFHPRCSKSTRPFVEDLATPAQLRQAEGLADASTLLGMDAGRAQRSYKDLQLRTQVADRQKRLATAKLFA